MPQTLVPLSRLPKELFWSAPLELDSDFTAEDPLALDYLGQQVGNWLFRGFTTRTSRAQYYAVVLYGLHLADVAIQAYGYPADDKTRTQLFERWERFWSLATLESRGGVLERGDQDAMRGVRGATREWSSGEKPLRLDFPLISRQLELGGLGAYLTSLREYGLVFPATMRVTPAAQAILLSFWSEPKQRAARRYEEYALVALDLEKAKLPRKFSGLSLRKIGESSRLSSIIGRPEQQERLWEILFAGSKDGSTLPLAMQLIHATGEGVRHPEVLLEGILSGRWGNVDPTSMDKVRVAIAFGRLAQFLLGCFDRAYEFVDQHGWVADVDAVANAAFPDSEMARLSSLCEALHEAKESLRFGKLAFHGPDFLSLVIKLGGSNRNACFEHLLMYHRVVQKSRRGSGAWIRQEQNKIVMQVAGYNGYKTQPGFPGFKLGMVRQLLEDLGMLA